MAIFGDLGSYFIGNVRKKANNIIWWYATPYRPVIDCKMNDLFASCYFMSKSFFGQQGCHALTFVLATLSCF